MFGREKKTVPQGTYTSALTDAELKKLGAARLRLQLAAGVLFAVPPLVLKQRALAVMNARHYTAGMAAYALAVFFVSVWQLTVLFLSLKRYAMKKEIPAKNAAKNGFEKHTWAAIEWQLYATILATLFDLVLTVAAFSVESLVVTIASAISATASYFVMKISVTFARSLTFVPPDAEQAPQPNADGENESADETEDFYDR